MTALAWVPLINHHDIIMHGGVEVQLQTFLTLALDGGEGSVSRPSFHPVLPLW
jgi:hypothetical protein